MPWREILRLKTFSEEHRDIELIWVQIKSTEGSTYRKAGAWKLVAPSGKSCGLLSGGCLESAIVETALAVGEDPETHSFDATSEQDRLFGYNLGCEGRLILKFQKITGSKFLQLLKTSQLESQLSVRVVGAGPDLDPLFELMQWTHWDVGFFTSQTDLLEERQQQHWPIRKLNHQLIFESIGDPKRTALLLMSHNYPTDLDILAQAADWNLAFVGVLGPRKRKQQMLEDLPTLYDIHWPDDSNLFGPVGESGFGEGEDAIALSIVSQLQKRFFGQVL